MTGRPDPCPPDTINPQSPPETPPQQSPSEAPLEDTPSFDPARPDEQQPTPSELPPNES